MNARILILMMAALLLTAVPAHAESVSSSCDTSESSAQEQGNQTASDGNQTQANQTSSGNETGSGDIASDTECQTTASVTFDCTLIGITNHGEINIDPDGCIWPTIDRLVHGGPEPAEVNEPSQG